jgi:hypothetical protein
MTAVMASIFKKISSKPQVKSFAVETFDGFDAKQALASAT